MDEIKGGLAGAGNELSFFALKTEDATKLGISTWRSLNSNHLKNLAAPT